MSAWLWWVIVAVMLLGIELLTLDLIFAMLAVGVLAGAAATALGANFIVAFLIAMVVALAGIFVLRPIALRQLRKGPAHKSGVAALTGTIGTVLEFVDTRDGRVQVGGEIWSARSGSDTTFTPGTQVEVLQVDGAHLVIGPKQTLSDPPHE